MKYTRISTRKKCCCSGISNPRSHFHLAWLLTRSYRTYRDKKIGDRIGRPAYFAKGANSDDLQTLFIKHLGETKRQVVRLRKSFGIIGAKPTGEHCKGMESIIDEGRDALEKDEDGASFDSGFDRCSA